MIHLPPKGSSRGLPLTVTPPSDFRANVASFVDQVRESHRPLVWTQHGRSAAVPLGVEHYEELVEELELLRDIVRAEGQLDSDEGLSEEEATKRLRKYLER